MSNGKANGSFLKPIYKSELSTLCTFPNLRIRVYKNELLTETITEGRPVERGLDSDFYINRDWQTWGDDTYKLGNGSVIEVQRPRKAPDIRKVVL